MASFIPKTLLNTKKRTWRQYVYSPTNKTWQWRKIDNKLIKVKIDQGIPKEDGDLFYHRNMSTPHLAGLIGWYTVVYDDVTARISRSSYTCLFYVFVW